MNASRNQIQLMRKLALAKFKGLMQTWKSQQIMTL